MKKLFALLLALMMIFSLAACGDNNKPDADKDSSAISQNGDQSVGENNSGEENNNGGSTAELPEGLKSYVGQYPFLADFVYPEGATVTEFDDSDYSDDKMVSITFESFDSSKLDAYLDKANVEKIDGYDFAAIMHTDDEPLFVVDFSGVDDGLLYVEVYNYSGSAGSVTLSDATIDGYDLPAEALKYVGTLNKAYSDTDKVFYIKAKSVSDGAFDELLNYYASNGGTLDEANSTSSEKVYTFSWGAITATHFSVDAELSIEITLN